MEQPLVTNLPFQLLTNVNFSLQEFLLVVHFIFPLNHHIKLFLLQFKYINFTRFDSNPDSTDSEGGSDASGSGGEKKEKKKKKEKKERKPKSAKTIVSLVLTLKPKIVFLFQSQNKHT